MCSTVNNKAMLTQ